VTLTRQQRFEAIAAEVAEPVLRYALRRTDAHTADDVLAETLLVAWRRLEGIPADGALPWCYGVARNCLANLARSARRQQNLVERLVLFAPPTEVAEAAELPDPRVHQALVKLRDQDRELLRLSAWEDLMPHEIAIVLGISASTVSVRLHRARQRLATVLEAP
jgi:RNA polymerase sigma-70 factor (ECF subfamily)